MTHLYDNRVRIEEDDLLAIRYRVNTTLIGRTPEWSYVIRVLDATSIARGLTFHQRQERPSGGTIGRTRFTGAGYGERDSEE
jgi:hypothetical protein